MKIFSKVDKVNVWNDWHIVVKIGEHEMTGWAHSERHAEQLREKWEKILLEKMENA